MCEAFLLINTFCQPHSQGLCSASVSLIPRPLFSSFQSCLCFRASAQFLLLAAQEVGNETKNLAKM